MTHTKHIAVLGAGSWGTAIAIHLAEFGHSVTLWGRDAVHMQTLQRNRENTRYLPGVTLPASLTATHDLSDCWQALHIIIAVPSHAFAAILAQLPDAVRGLAWLTKGIDPKTCLLLSELVISRFGKNFPMAAISGPSFAKEVACGLPTALVIAGNTSRYIQHIQNLFNQRTIRTYLSRDLNGVQLCGAVKNVLAIACGISDGLAYGANAKAALITRGLAEMSRLGSFWKAKPQTFIGLAGLGDLVLTCTDNQSRNRRFGLLLGSGQSIALAEQAIGQVVEGKSNAAQVCQLAAEHAIEMPICKQVNLVLQNKLSAQDAAESLMNRPLGNEY
jgi:glycerol-3-phosphate dehydrogenase (NAD(P)+)